MPNYDELKIKNGEVLTSVKWSHLVDKIRDNELRITNSLVIDDSGNVGIGTNNPEQELHIYKETDQNVDIRIGNKSGEKLDVFSEGGKIRNNSIYKKEGINVNFIEPSTNGFHIRTFERGVEAETLACGTGVTAAALSYAIAYPKRAAALLKTGGIAATAEGGDLKVRFTQNGHKFEDIWLCGPAEKVYFGRIK